MKVIKNTRIIAIFLVVVMVVSSIPFVVRAEGDNIDDAISSFEAIISALNPTDTSTIDFNNVPTNLSTAYEAYVVASNVKNGIETTVSVEQATQALNEAIDNVGSFVPNRGTQVVNVGTTDLNMEATGYYGNVLYTNYINRSINEAASAELYASTLGSWKYGQTVYAFSPEAVLLYDGVNDTSIPVISAIRDKNGLYNMGMDRMALTSYNKVMKLSTDWNGYTKLSETTNPFIYWVPNSGVVFSSRENVNHGSGTPYFTPTDIGNDDAYYFFKNSLKIYDEPSSTYLKIATQTYNVHGYYDYAGLTDNGAEKDITTNHPIYVIDYQALTNAMTTQLRGENYQKMFSDILSNEEKDGYGNLFKALDAATSFDIHTYDFSTSTEEKSIKAAAKIDSIIKQLENVELNGGAAYSMLLNQISRFENIMKNADCIYTNMKSAYDKYIVAREYVDAYKYGNLRSEWFLSRLRTYAEELRIAIDAMKPFSTDLSSVKGIRYSEDDSDISSDYYNNVAFFGNNSLGGAYNDVVNEIYMYADYPNAVLFNDGDTNGYPSMPILQHVANKSGTTYRYVYYTYPSDGNTTTANSLFNIGDGITSTANSYWNGYSENDENNSDALKMSFNNAIVQDHHFVGYYHNDRDNNPYINLNTKPGGANKPMAQGTVLRFVGSTTIGHTKNTDIYGDFDISNYYSSNFETADFYKSYQLTWAAGTGGKIFTSQKYDNWNFDASSIIYVVDYQPLGSYISHFEDTYIDLIKHVDNYDKDSEDYSALLGNIDRMTAVDPKNYYVNIDSDNETTQLATKTEQYASAIKNALPTPSDIVISDSSSEMTSSDGVLVSGSHSEEIDDKNWYDNLRTAISSAVVDEQGCYDDDAYALYMTALSEARTAMIEVTDSQGYSDKNDKASVIAEKTSNLEIAIEMLSRSENNHRFIYSSQDENEVGEFDCYLNYSHNCLEADMSVYNQLNIAYKQIDKKAYSSESLASLKSAKDYFDMVFDPEVTPKGIEPQNYIDAKITYLLSKINAESENEELHEITFNVNIDGIDYPVTVDSNNNSLNGIKYGTNITLDASKCSELDGDCYAWEVDDGSSTQRVPIKGNTYNLNVQGDVTVTAFYNKEETDNVRVQIRNVYHKVITEKKYSLSTVVSFDVTNNRVTIGEDIYNISAPLGYDITGFSINEYALSDNITVQELLTKTWLDYVYIDPVVTEKSTNYSSGTSYSIGFGDSMGSVSYVDRETTEGEINFDDLVTVTSSAENIYAIAVKNGDKYIPLAYKENESDTSISLSFYANNDMDFYVITKSSREYVVNGENKSSACYLVNGIEISDSVDKYNMNKKLPFIYSFTRKADNDGYKFTTFSYLTINCNATITECGTLINNASVSDDDIIIESSLPRIVNNNRAGQDKNQFSLTLTYKNTYTGSAEDAVKLNNIPTRAYVKYNYTFSGTSLDSVNYGNVVISSYTPVE